MSSLHSGNNLLRLYQERLIEKQVAFHLGCVKIMINSGEVYEKGLEMAYEKNYRINIDGCRTI